MTRRKFHRYVFHYEVLSEEPLEEDLGVWDLHNITYSGPCSGRMLDPEHEEIDGQKAAKLLIEQASDPEFFQIDADGNDVDDETDNEEEEGSQ